jgi:hypothetical protein
MDDREAHEFYANPQNLCAAGPGRRRKAPRLTSMIPVRFTPETIERVRDFSSTEGTTVSGWIRRAVLRALTQPERPAGLTEGSGRRGELRALTSSLGSRTFSCPHLSIGGVTSASCGICGPLRSAA